MKYNSYYEIGYSIMQFIAEDNQFYYGTLCYELSPIGLATGKKEWIKVNKVNHRVIKYHKSHVKEFKKIEKKDLFIMFL